MAILDKVQERELEGVTYKVQPVPASLGLKPLVRLVNVVAPLMGAASEGPAAIFAILPTVLTEDDVERFAQMFGTASWYYADDGKAVPLVDANRATHFAGNYYAMLRWLILCIEVNYGGFFSGLLNGKGLDGFLQAANTPIKSTVSPGTAG